MSTDHDDRHGADGRLLDLLADKALFGLDAAEERECADLLASGSVTQTGDRRSARYHRSGGSTP